MRVTRRKLIRLGAFRSLASCILISLAWLVSLRWTVFVMAQFGDSIGLKGGTVWFLWTSDGLRKQLSAATGSSVELTWDVYGSERKTPMQWWVPLHISRAGRSQICLPIWPFALLTCGATVYLWRLRRRRPPPGDCAKCGYDRTGLSPQTSCPECGGKEVTAA